MIKAEELIACFNQMLAEHWGYIPNTSGQEWTQKEQDVTNDVIVEKYGQQWVGHRVADCSGAFVYAYKKYGLGIYHGSNRIARKYVVELLPISYAEPGMAAFKIRKPGDKYYDLPSLYKQSGDLNDYYHIGLVDTDGKHVINAQSTQTGVVRSSLSDFGCVAKLKAVEYQEKEEQQVGYEKATVVLPAGSKGSTVNMREGPGTNYGIMAKVPVGWVVEVISDQGQWCKIQYHHGTGWMQSNYLEYDGQTDETDHGLSTGEQKRLIDDALHIIDSANVAIAEALSKIAEAKETISGIVGQG